MASPHIVPLCTATVDVVKESDDYLVVHKPSGLLSVPGRLKENADSVYSRMAALYDDIHIVHRLDMDTSGLMVLAKGKEALRKLNWQFEKRQTYKEYTAVVRGIVSTDESEVTMPLICDWPNRPKQKVCYDTGKPAQTLVFVKSRDTENNQTRLLLKPVTGRSHQLRVHTAAIGHPILGCEFYADQEAYLAAPRLLLHASHLAFDCPTTQERITVDLPAPF